MQLHPGACRPLKTALTAAIMAVSIGACGAFPESEKAAAPDPAAPRHPIEVMRPAPVQGLVTAQRTHAGEPAVADCASCHATKPSQVELRSGAGLDEFHQGLVVAHGDRSCLSCHDSRDYSRLRLADGTPVAFADSMQLCAQCHGPQYRDYQHGSHGGMTGHWDLTRGGRSRNHCQSCHDPHHPAYPLLQPLPPPPDAVRSDHGEAGHD